MSDHVVTVGPVEGRPMMSAPAYRYRCSCGAHGLDRVAASTMSGRVTGKARNEALEQARADGIQHRREAEGRAQPPAPGAAALEAAGPNVVPFRKGGPL